MEISVSQKFTSAILCKLPINEIHIVMFYCSPLLARQISAYNTLEVVFNFCDVLYQMSLFLFFFLISKNLVPPSPFFMCLLAEKKDNMPG